MRQYSCNVVYHKILLFYTFAHFGINNFPSLITRDEMVLHAVTPSESSWHLVIYFFLLCVSIII